MMKRHSNNEEVALTGAKRLREVIESFGVGSQGSRLQSGKFEIRLLIVSKSAGSIIGKGGENIKRIRSQYDASLSVPDSNSPERIITIVADLDNSLECVREVLSRLDEYGDSGREMEARLLVHQSHAGAVIGRSGFKIKELREQTNTNLKVFTQCCPMSTDRIVQIHGESDKIVDAIRAIVAMLHEIPVKGPIKPYDTINYDPSYVGEYGGHQPDRSYRGGLPPPSSQRSMGGIRGGMRSSGGGYGDHFAPLMGGRGPPMGGRGPPMGGRGHDYGPPPSSLPPYSGGLGGPMQSTQVTIPADLGGTIIGKGGERINHIREDSGAHIILNPSEGGDERIITISGTQMQIQTAQYLLQQCVRSSITGRKYLNEHQGRSYD